MKIKIFIILLILSFSLLQAGSVISSKGLGIPMGLSNGRSMGMGSAAIAVPDIYDISRINPAGLSSIRLSRFSIQYIYESNRNQDHTNSTRTPYSNFDGFIFAVPVASHAAFSIGLIPYSRIDYRTYTSNQINSETFNQILSGSGGINALSISGSLIVINRLSIGFTGRLYFGKIEKNWLIDFSESGFYATKNTYSTQLFGSGFTLGIQYHMIPNLTLGFILSPESKLKNHTYRDYKSMDENASITYIHFRDTLNGSIQLPASFGAGVGWQMNKNILFGGDFIYTPWEDFKINNTRSKWTQNVQKCAIGVEYYSTINPYASLFSRSAYRLGFSYEPYYLSDANGNKINQWWITTGIGIPVWNNSSRANIAFAFGKRGDLNVNGLSENIFRIILSLDAGEKWFEKRQ